MAKAEVARAAVVIGGSAGSLDAILQILPDVHAASGAAFIFVLHRRTDTENLLTDILSRKTSMPVREVEDKDSLQPNCVYVAPPDYHLLLENPSSFSLDTSEKVHYSRPSIDVAFESVVEQFSGRTVGVLLSGANADGAEGLKKIKAAGGVTIVQAPASAEVDFMPRQAINNDAALFVLPTNQIAKAINDATTQE